MNKNIIYSETAQRKLKAGVDKLADAVKSTLGPGGRLVALENKFGYPPKLTKDGVSVAKVIELKDPDEDMAAQLVKSAASKTADEVGDGTTTVTVLTQAIVREGIKNITAGANPMDLKRGIDIAALAIAEEIKKLAVPVTGHEQIAQVGTISANNDPEVGKMLADVIEKVGEDGVVSLEETGMPETTFEVTQGMQIESGFIHPYFITDAERAESTLEDVYILLVDYKLNNVNAELYPFLDKLFIAFDENKIKRGNLLIIADDFDQSVVRAMITQLRGTQTKPPTLRNCLVRTPEFGNRKKEVLKDLAILTGATVVSREASLNIENANISVLGKAERVVADVLTTKIIGAAGRESEIAGRIKELRAQFEKSQNKYDKEKLAERYGKLGGGAAKILIGTNSEAETGSKKDLIEDALFATKAAKKEGIVPGGGTALIRAASATHVATSGMRADIVTGIQIVLRAVTEPCKLIAENAGYNGEMTAAKVAEASNPNYGFNALTGVYEDLVESGVIDPARVVRLAVMNSASVAGMILTTNCCITEEKLNLAPVDVKD